jgi:NAD(P)H-dependent FMN reductase
LLISGSLRQQSISTAVLSTVQTLKPAIVTADFYECRAELPHFNPDHDTGELPWTVSEESKTSRALSSSKRSRAGATWSSTNTD